MESLHIPRSATTLAPANQQDALVIVGMIFARGGSKGLPGKNILPLAGKPLLAHAITTAKQVPRIQRVIVSTDDAAIAAVARQYGAEVPFLRPPELATDHAPELLAWKHALTTIAAQTGRAVDVMVSVPTTAPLRRSEDVVRCVELLLASAADLVVTVTEANRSPYFNMVTLDHDQNATLVIPPAHGTVTRRQDAPTVYDMTTVAYAARGPYVLATDTLMAGRVKAIIVPRERALDIDDAFDFAIAEHRMTQAYANP